MKQIKKTRLGQWLLGVFCLALVLTAAGILSSQPGDSIVSRVISQQEAGKETFDWGTFHTYHQGTSYGTKDVLTGVAVIKPGMEIHPPHVHAEEEYLMVLAGQGTWHLNGKTFSARKGDILYASPWDIHGIKNTGETALEFVVWKWNSKGVALVPEPAKEKK